MNLEDTILVLLVATNVLSVAWALGLQLKNRLLRQELYARTQWNLRQIKKNREGKS